MDKLIKKYFLKNRFYLSVIITGILSLILGLFYVFFKKNLFESTSSLFLDGTGVLESYVSVSNLKPNFTIYFLIIFLLSLFLFFGLTFVFKFILKQRYRNIFNLFGVLNILLILGFIFEFIFLHFSVYFTYVLLIFVFILYLVLFYRYLKMFFKVSLRQRIILLLIIVLLVFGILLILKFFV